MPWTSEHLDWLVQRAGMVTNEGRNVNVWELDHQPDNRILSAWAKHFRNHYCLDTQIDALRNRTPHTRHEYLETVKFPDRTAAPGPSIRAGDFGEILVADYLQYRLQYWVPRSKYSDKSIRNESVKGCDVVGFKVIDPNNESPRDVLAIYESKCQFSGRDPDPRLQDAIDGSAKDHIRRGETLNALKQRFLDREQQAEVATIERFQDLEGRPYTEEFGAVAIFSDGLMDPVVAQASVCANHPSIQNLNLIIITGRDLMVLVHELYRRAAVEA